MKSDQTISPEAVLPPPGETAGAQATLGSPEVAPVKRRGGRPKGSAAPTSTLPARSAAAIILDVLGGMRSTTAAAQALGISPARYYAFESRAVAGLIAACEPRPPGPQPAMADPARELVRISADRDRLAQEISRLRALLRSTQRSLGIVPSPPRTEVPKATAQERGKGKEKKGEKSGRKKPHSGRRPRVRALTIIRRLMREHPPQEEAKAAASTNQELTTIPAISVEGS